MKNVIDVQKFKEEVFCQFFITSLRVMHYTHTSYRPLSLTNRFFTLE